MTGIPSPPAPPQTPTSGPGRPSPGDVLARGWVGGLAWGGLAFVIMAGLGQVAAFVVYAVQGGHGPVATYAKLGWFYFGWFHHVAVTVSLPNFSLGQISGLPSAVSGGASLTYHVGLALMLATFLAIALLFAGGRAVADRAGGGGVARVLHGMKVAPAYAIPPFLISRFVSMKLAIPQNPFATGSLEVRSSALQSFLLPLLIAAVAGAAGGLRSGRYELLARDPWGRRLAGALAGGLRMFLLGLALSFVGLLVLAVVQPDATKAYFDAVSGPPADETAVIIAHHVLVLPNQSMWVLVPAMGGCDGAYGNGISTSFLCYWKYPRQVSFSPADLISGTPAVRTDFGTAPPGYFLFLLVPALSVLLGGRHAARRRARFRSEAAAVGAAAGVAFAVLVAAASWLASVSAGASAKLLSFSGGASVRVGPNVLVGGLLALVWGVGGGWIGGWLAGRELPVRAALQEPGAGPSHEAETATPPDLPPPPGEQG